MSKPALPRSRSDFDSPSGDAAWQALLCPAKRSSTPLSSEQLVGKRVLITGAGGSIGSALALAVHASSPSALVLLDTSESGLYQIDRRLREAGSMQHRPILGSVCDQSAIEYLFEQHEPQIVFHAAALKHVPLMEQNPFPAIANNSLGTLTLTQVATRHFAERLILVSTDKAVDPHSIMGVSKRLAELIVLTHACSETRLIAVRLCNVIGTQGSVLPLFLDQLAHDEPLTITHPKAERYFITLDRAVESIFAALDASAGAALFLSDPGVALRILDLAEHLLRSRSNASSFTFTGLRPGEKLSESLVSARERLSAKAVSADGLLRAIESPAPAPRLLHSVLEDLCEAIHTHDLARLLHAIAKVVPEYEPSSVIAGALKQDLAAEVRV